MKLHYFNIYDDIYHEGNLEHIPASRLSRVAASLVDGIYDRPLKKSELYSICAGILLYKHLGVSDDSQIITKEHGKPYLRDGSPYFSISHGGDYVVLAVSNNEIGVDIESIGRRIHSSSVAQRCFTQAELSYTSNATDDNEDFFRIWTAKEAVMKATGLGFSLAMNSFSVIPTDSPCVCAGRLFSIATHIHDGHVVSVAEEIQSCYSNQPCYSNQL